MCSCTEVSCWSGGHEEASQRSRTRIWQTTDRTPSTPGKTYIRTHRDTQMHFRSAYQYRTTKYWLYINPTNTGVILNLFLYLIHRTNRVLQTKRISNHRNTVTFVFKMFHLFLLFFHYTRTVFYLQAAMFVLSFTTSFFLWSLNLSTFLTD